MSSWFACSSLVYLFMFGVYAHTHHVLQTCQMYATLVTLVICVHTRQSHLLHWSSMFTPVMHVTRSLPWIQVLCLTPHGGTSSLSGLSCPPAAATSPLPPFRPCTTTCLSSSTSGRPGRSPAAASSQLWYQQQMNSNTHDTSWFCLNPAATAYCLNPAAP